MKEKNKINPLYLAGTILSAIILIVAICLGVYAAGEAAKTSNLGVDPKEDITKIYTDNQTIRIVGKRDGEVYAIDLNGETLWNVGKLSEVSVYDITAKDEKVFVAYADGKIARFSLADAENMQSGENFSERCTFYSAAENIEGNVSNTSLIVSEDGKTLFIRAIYRSRSQKNKIIAFNVESGKKTSIAQSSKKVAGSAVHGGRLYYSVGSSIMVYDGENKEEIADIEEQIVSLSVSSDKVSVITENNNIVNLNLADKERKTAKLGETLNGNYVFSTGENFVAKINNGGVVVINSERMKVTLSMSAGDKSNLIMWTNDGFALRDDSDVGNTSVTYYSVAQAHRKNAFTTVKVVCIIAVIVFALAAAYFGAGLSKKARAAMNAKFIAFFGELNRSKLVYISMIVPFALLIVFYYIPIVLGFRLSFYDYLPGVKDVFVGFKNFAAVYASTEFWKSSLIMLVFLIADLLKAIIPPIIFAEAICAVRHEKFSLWVRILLFLPGVLPGVASTLVWSQGVFGATSNGLVNTVIGVFVPNFAKNWINSQSTATSICSLIAFGFPWIGSYLIFFGAITGINTSYFEAAKLDGCTWIKRIIKIDLPLILPQIKYIFVTSFIASVQNYTNLFVIYGTTGGGSGELKTPALLMYREIINANYGVASVMGVTIFLFLSVATFFNFRMQSDNS